MLGRATALLFVAGAVLACSRARTDRGTVAARSIDQVLAAHTDSLMRLPGVVGTAIGSCDAEGGRCIKVLLSDSSAATRSRIPSHLDGYPVVVEVAGTITPR